MSVNTIQFQEPLKLSKIKSEFKEAYSDHRLTELIEINSRVTAYVKSINFAPSSENGIQLEWDELLSDMKYKIDSLETFYRLFRTRHERWPKDNPPSPPSSFSFLSFLSEKSIMTWWYGTEDYHDAMRRDQEESAANAESTLAYLLSRG